MAADVVMDVVSYPPQTPDRTRTADFFAQPFENFYRPVERHPRHYFRMGEVLRRPAHFPNALVSPAPNPRQMVENGGADRHGAIHCGQAVKMGVVQRVENFAVDIELCLPDRRIADAYRPRSFIAG